MGEWVSGWRVAVMCVCAGGGGGTAVYGVQPGGQTARIPRAASLHLVATHKHPTCDPSACMGWLHCACSNEDTTEAKHRPAQKRLFGIGTVQCLVIAALLPANILHAQLLAARICVCVCMCIHLLVHTVARFGTRRRCPRNTSSCSFRLLSAVCETVRF